jgi:hypothetical protein
MKKKLISLRLKIIVIFLAIIYSCTKSNEVYTGLAVYKTRGDYFLNVNTWKTDNAPTAVNPEYNRYGNLDSDTVYMFRKQLVNGYILATESTVDDYFTDMTFRELLNYYYETGNVYFPLDSIFERIIDTDPYTEFYVEYNLQQKFCLTDTAEVNAVIINGELEKYFKRLK